MHSITVYLDWFSSNLHSQNKGHWRSKVAPVKVARQQAHIAALNACKRLQIDPPRWKVSAIKYFFDVPDNRRRDISNMIQSCKPYLDGCVDAGLIVGDHWQVLGLMGAEVEVAAGDPGVRFLFVNLEG